MIFDTFYLKRILMQNKKIKSYIHIIKIRRRRTMKTIIHIFSIIGLVLGSCTISFKAAAQYDDIYYNPKDEPAAKKETVVAKETEREMSDYEKYVAALERQQEDSLKYAYDTLEYEEDQDYIDQEYYEED